jgi:hypothetical protein
VDDPATVPGRRCGKPAGEFRVDRARPFDRRSITLIDLIRGDTDAIYAVITSPRLFDQPGEPARTIQDIKISGCPFIVHLGARNAQTAILLEQLVYHLPQHSGFTQYQDPQLTFRQC